MSHTVRLDAGSYCSEGPETTLGYATWACGVSVGYTCREDLAARRKNNAKTGLYLWSMCDGGKPRDAILRSWKSVVESMWTAGMMPSDSFSSFAIFLDLWALLGRYPSLCSSSDMMGMQCTRGLCAVGGLDGDVYGELVDAWDLVLSRMANLWYRSYL